MTKRYKWAVVGLLWFVCFFNYADRQAIFSIFPKLKEEFGFDAVQLGLIGSAFMWVYAAGATFAGFIADRFPRKPLILGGCLFWSVVTMLTGWCSRLGHFVAVRALEGVGETVYFPATMSLISDYHDKTTLSRAFSLHQSSVYVGTIGGSWLGALLAERYGWRTAFYFFGGAGIILAAALWQFLREPARNGLPPTEIPALPPLQVTEAGKEILRQPIAVLLLMAFLGANFVATIFLTWTPTFLVEKFGFRLAAAGLSGTAFIHLASALSAPLGGVLADRLVCRFAGGRMLVQAFGLLVGAAFVGVVGLTSSVATLITAMTLFGFCKGLYDANIFASLFDVIAPRLRATATGVMNTVGWGGGALGPLAVGYATQYGRHEKAIDNMSEAIAFGAIIYVIGAALLIVAAFKVAPGRAPHVIAMKKFS
jgi:MFS family permease